jgi:hypothetical protein
MTDILRPAEAWLPVDVDELEYLPADFEDKLVTGETLVSVTATLEAIDGVDASASSRLVGSVEITGTAVRQFVQGVLEDVTYLLRFTATTNDGGRVVVIGGTFKGVRVS